MTLEAIVYLYSSFFINQYRDAKEINCISRKDKNKNLFLQEKNPNSRWNLYAQLAIEEDSLVCANETYRLKKICYYMFNDQPCTLQGTGEVVDIGNIE